MGFSDDALMNEQSKDTKMTRNQRKGIERDDAPVRELIVQTHPWRQSPRRAPAKKAAQHKSGQFRQSQMRARVHRNGEIFLDAPSRLLLTLCSQSAMLKTIIPDAQMHQLSRAVSIVEM